MISFDAGVAAAFTVALTASSVADAVRTAVARLSCASQISKVVAHFGLHGRSKCNLQSIDVFWSFHMPWAGQIVSPCTTQTFTWHAEDHQQSARLHAVPAGTRHRVLVGADTTNVRAPYSSMWFD